MHRIDASHLPSLTSNLHGSSGHHFSTSNVNPTNANPTMVPETGVHLSTPIGPHSTMPTSSPPTKAIAAPRGPDAKAITLGRFRCLRDAKATCVEAKEVHLRAPTGKTEDSGVCDQLVRAACVPPSIGSLSATSSSQARATFRSHSFGGEQHFHSALAAFTGMETTVGRELENTDRSSNLSLHYLITSARRGNTRPYSADASPTINGGNIICGGGRRLVKLDPGAHQELDKAVSELSRLATLDQPPDSRVKAGLDMAFSRCALTGNEESQAGTESSSVVTPCLKRSSSCSDEQSNESAVSMTPIDEPTQCKSRRLAFGAADSGRIAAPSSVACVAGPQPLLRLPDPSTISDRRTLFAVSKVMCSRSSIESFGTSSHAASDRDDCSPPCPSSSSSSRMGESSDGGRDGLAVDRSALGHADDVKSVSEDTELSLLDMSLDADDDAPCTSSSSPQAIRSLQGSPRLSKSSSSCRSWQEEEDSVAFSMDSVCMRKKQLDNSQHTPSNGERTILTDWAVDSSNQSNTNGRHAHPPSPPRQINCDIDIDALMDDINAYRSSQPLPTGNDDDDDEERSFASFSSLDTNLSERV
jgi:hypothetical protein